jgi:hypothetical protein
MTEELDRSCWFRSGKTCRQIRYFPAFTPAELPLSLAAVLEDVDGEAAVESLCGRALLD